MHLALPSRPAGVLANAAAPAVRLATLPFRHVRWKIILLYSLVVLLLGGVATYLATDLVTGSLRERFDNQLVEAGRVSADAVARQERRHVETVRAIAFTEGVPDMVAAGDSQELRPVVESIAINGQVEYVQVLSGAGERVEGIYLTDPDSLQYDELPSDEAPADW